MKNVQAVQVLKSWCNAVKVPFSVVADNVLEVHGKGVDNVKVVVSEEPIETPDTNILASDVLDSDCQIGFLMFGLITEAAGYGQLQPVNRGQAPERVSYKEDFDMVVFRHREFRAAPNPSKEEFQKYERVIQIAVRSMFNKNYKTCQRNSLDQNDLKQYAYVWTVNYLHKYKLDASDDQNQKLLMSHLKQRYYELFKLIAKRQPNTTPSLETVRVALYENTGASKMLTRAGNYSVTNVGQFGTTGGFDDGEVVQPVFFNDPRIEDEEDEEYIKRHSQIDRRTPTGRRNSARALLQKMLGDLPKERRIQLLTEAANNTELSKDARNTAVRYLRTEGVELGELEEDNDIGVSEPLSPSL